MTITRPTVELTALGMRTTPATPNARTAASQWARGLARMALEVICGARNISRADRWMMGKASASVETYRRIWIQHNGVRRPIIKLGPTHMSSPCSGVVEACISYTINERTRAMAMRLEKHAAQWVITEVEL